MLADPQSRYHDAPRECELFLGWDLQRGKFHLHCAHRASEDWALQCLLSLLPALLQQLLHPKLRGAWLRRNLIRPEKKGKIEEGGGSYYGL